MPKGCFLRASKKRYGKGRTRNTGSAFTLFKMKTHRTIMRTSKTKIESILDVIGLSADTDQSPSYKVILVNGGIQLTELKKSAVHQRDIENTSQVLVFAVFENRNEGVNKVMTALGTAMVTAALAGIDSTGIEDFDSIGVDSLLGFREEGLHSVALLSMN
jgi:hypothetical protein